MQGGGNLEWVRPLTPQGTRAHGVLGCYRGGWEHWNLKWLKPGFTARMVAKKNVAKRRYQGYVVATKEHAQLAGDIPFTGPGGISDALLETADMILMVAPIPRIAETIRQQQEQTKAAVEGNVYNYLSTARGGETPYQGKRPIRFDEGTEGGFYERAEH